MTALGASAVAALLREFGQRSALRGGNPFRAKAYGRAADNVLALSLPLDQIIAQDRLREIPGIGDAIADIVKKLHATGTHPALEKMRKEIPAGVLEMLTIPGLRADKVIKLYQELGLTSLEELEEAAREGKLQKVKGLGASLQTKILRGLELRREAQGRRHMHKADEFLRSAEKHLKEARPEIIRITRAGDFRRGSELAGDLSLVAEVAKLSGGPKAITAGGQLAAHLTDAAHYGVTLLKDGMTLAARIWLPEDAEKNPVPAILEYLPYRKRDGTYERDALTHPYLAGHGYAGVRVDIRGSGESTGLLFDEYAKQEQDDGVEVIAWLAAQPWCNGRLG